MTELLTSLPVVCEAPPPSTVTRERLRFNQLDRNGLQIQTGGQTEPGCSFRHFGVMLSTAQFVRETFDDSRKTQTQLL